MPVLLGEFVKRSGHARHRRGRWLRPTLLENLRPQFLNLEMVVWLCKLMRGHFNGSFKSRQEQNGSMAVRYHACHRARRLMDNCPL